MFFEGEGFLYSTYIRQTQILHSPIKILNVKMLTVVSQIKLIKDINWRFKNANSLGSIP